MDHVKEEQDFPPFALADSVTSPQHLFQAETIVSSSSRDASAVPISKGGDMLMRSHLSSPPSPAPGLVESTVTDASSVRSSNESDVIRNADLPSLDASSATFLLSSIPSVDSRCVALGSSSSYIPPILPSENLSNPASDSQRKSHSHSVRFSQLLQDADDTNGSSVLGRSRMPAVPEGEEEVVFDNSAHLLHDESTILHAATGESSLWMPSIQQQPLLSNRTGSQVFQYSPLETPLLSMSPTDRSIAVAKTSIRAVIDDDQSFEVSMEMEDTTVKDVMNIVGNPELLRLWCNPIESLIVTSKGAPSEEAGREYDAEWIEATTAALEAPASHVGFLYSTAQRILESLGFASYGRITMFVERRRGQVGLTVGPFSGGIHAAHSISVAPQMNGKLLIVDRVRLNHDEEENWGVMATCLTSCLLPTLGSYMDQVATSMARLRLLVEQGEFSEEGGIVSA